MSGFGVSLSESKRKSFFLESSVFASPFNNHTGKKAEIQFSSLIVAAVQCNAVKAWVFISCLQHMKYSALCDVLFCTLINWAQHIRTSSPVTFLDWKYCRYTVQNAEFCGESRRLKTKELITPSRCQQSRIQGIMSILGVSAPRDLHFIKLKKKLCFSCLTLSVQYISHSTIITIFP